MRAIKSLLLLICLASCAPVYETSYDIIPPATAKGKACAAKCLTARSNCDETCTIDEAHCMARMRLEEKRSELSYVTVRGSNQTPVVVNQNRPARYYSCNTNRCKTVCMETYHQCHIDCGGEVVTHNTCTAFCD
jgi:hypothetical protein